ncbi:MAG: ABC transporter substrate-binding protein [Alphaproteobacteria bacterium]
MIKGWQTLASAVILGLAVLFGGPGLSVAQTKPEGEIRFAAYVTIPPVWLDPSETNPGNLTPFWMLYALHDALAKPMPGNRMAPSLVEAWSESPDKLSYEFKLRRGVKFHNGDPFTADDVKFSFERAKGAQLKEKVKEVIVADPHTVWFVLHEPWPDFMTTYGTLWSAAAWITPKNYFEKVGPDGFKKHPIGLGPYKFVSMKPGIELVLEANEDYWGKMPSVKRLVYLSVPEGTTRLAMLKRGEADIAYLLEGQLAASIKDDPTLKLAFSGGIGTHHLDFFDMWDPKSPWADPRVRKAASLAIDRKGLSEAETLGASKPNGNIVLKIMEYALPIEPDPYDPEQAKKLLAEAGYPNGFDGGDLTPIPPYFAVGEAAVNYLGAVGIRVKLRTMERAAFFSAFQGKKLKGVCFCTIAIYGNASTRLAENVPSSGTYAYGGWPDVDELYRKQLTETDPAKREQMLHEIQRILHERVRFAPIYDYFWASGIGPRIAEPALMKIDPFPWAAPLEDVKLKQP